MRLIPKNWAKFQHYKDRCPPWIKLHKNILDDRQFMCLPLASKALAPLLWLLASESKDGTFDADIPELSFRLRMSESDIAAGLNPLMDKGFFLDASTMLAPRLQVAVPEAEAEGEGEAKTEAKKELSAPVVAVPDLEETVVKVKGKKSAPDYSDEDFNRFWEAYGYDAGRHKALKAWRVIKPDAQLVETIIQAAWVYNKANPTKAYYKHATTWLNGKHWNDDPSTLLPKIARIAAKTQHQLNQEATARSLFGSSVPNRIIDMEVTSGSAENATPRLG